MKALLQVYPGDRVAWFAILVSLQSTIVIVLAWLMAHFVARRRPAVRHGIWFWALVSLLLGPPFAWAVERAGLAPVGLPILQSRSSTPPSSTPIGQTRAVDQEGTELTPPDMAAKLPIRMLMGEHAGAKPNPAIGHSPADWLRAACAIAYILWALGVAWLLVRLAVGWVVPVRLKDQSKPLDVEPFGSILSEVRMTLGAKVLPQILVSGRLDRPVAAGILRAVVVLPAAILEPLDPRRLRDVLVHVMRGDPLVGLLQRLVEVGYWPQPLVRLLNRELSRAREELCDNHVLREGDRVAYSWTLLEVAEIAAGPNPFPAAFGLLSTTWRLEDRIAGILDDRRDLMTSSNRRASALVMASFLLATACFAGLSPAAGTQGAIEGEQAGPAENPASLAARTPAGPDQDPRDAAPVAAPEISGAVNRIAGQLKQGPVEQVPDKDRSGLFLLDVTSGEATMITDEPELGLKYCGSPRWSGDGRRILFDATPGNDWRQSRLKSIDVA